MRFINIGLYPLRLFQYFSRKKELERRLMSDYLKQMAFIANEIAQIWEGVVDNLLKYKLKILTIDHREMGPIYNVMKNNFETDYQSGLEKIIPIEYSRTCNAGPISLMHEYYQHTSKIWPQKKYLIDKESIFMHLGTILTKRDLTKKLVEEELQNINNLIIYDKSNTKRNFSDLKESIIAIRKEAAALQYKAESFELKYFKKN